MAYEAALYKGCLDQAGRRPCVMAPCCEDDLSFEAQISVRAENDVPPMPSYSRISSVGSSSEFFIRPLPDDGKMNNDLHKLFTTSMKFLVRV